MAIEWKHVEEYPIGKMTGEQTFDLFAGYDDMQLLSLYGEAGCKEVYAGYINDDGTLCDACGNDVGWTWQEVEWRAKINFPNGRGHVRGEQTHD